MLKYGTWFWRLGDYSSNDFSSNVTQTDASPKPLNQVKIKVKPILIWPDLNLFILQLWTYSDSLLGANCFCINVTEIGGPEWGLQPNYREARVYLFCLLHTASSLYKSPLEVFLFSCPSSL